jgi:hypothetical protein
MEKLKKNDILLVRSLILMIVTYSAIALLFGVLGVFFVWYMWASWILICILLYLKKILVFPRPSQEMIFYMLIAATFSLLVAFFTVPTIFGGRDQGALAHAAIQLAKNHHLISHSTESATFFDVYGYGQALNFPGFFYTPDGGLLTQFPLPYITFLAGFFALFDVAGLTVANSILLISFIISITCVARYYLSQKMTILFLGLLLTSFSIGWFAKFTLSENLASALLWSAVFLYLSLKKDPSRVTYVTLFITVSILLFSRLEGIWFGVIFAFLIIKNTATRAFLAKDPWWHLIFPLTVLFTIGCVVAIMSMPFIITMTRVFFDTTTASPSASHTPFFIDTFSSLANIYMAYGLLIPLILTAIFSVCALRYKKMRPYLFPIVIMLPLFSYYLFPHISDDHPWMLRRFVFALLPTTILISTFLISLIPHKWSYRRLMQTIIVTIIILTNIPAFFTFFTYAENHELDKQLSEFAQQFNENDLVLVDKNAAGSGWSMIDYPLRSLHNVSTVYFFNPKDIEQIDTSKFDHIYLVTPNTKKAHYEKELSRYIHYANKYIFIAEQLSIEKDPSFPIVFPHKEKKVIRGTIYELKK